MTSIIAPGTDGFGTDVGIHTQNPNQIQIVWVYDLFLWSFICDFLSHHSYRAQFDENAWCLGDRTRRYLVIQENAVEQNHPTAWLCIPANCICPGTDNIWKYYFDRGPYDQQNCWWKIGFYNGAPSFFPNEGLWNAKMIRVLYWKLKINFFFQFNMFAAAWILQCGSMSAWHACLRATCIACAVTEFVCSQLITTAGAAQLTPVGATIIADALDLNPASPSLACSTSLPVAWSLDPPTTSLSPRRTLVLLGARELARPK